ncbi:MAG: hypothetical protein M3540_12200, partial [Actinomycetota bacterium]|nr:hypothetical protein [Actinomycetota bacterium]
LPALMREARRQRNPELFWALFAAHQLRLVSAVAIHHLGYRVYRGESDAENYHRAGLELARRIRSGNFDLRLGSKPAEGAMRVQAGIVHLLVGPSRLAAFLVYSSLGFWGLFFFYRAFLVGVPDGDARLYLLLLCFLPTLVIAPSLISKQAWMLFTLGLASLGAAHLLTGEERKGLALAGAGIALAAIVRPHIAAMLAVSLALGSARVLRGRPALRNGALVSTAGLVALAAKYVQRWGVEPGGSLASLLRQTGAKSNFGGSAFTPATPTRLRDVPLAVATVLFRPHPLEAQNARVRIASLESMFLLGLSIARMRSLTAAPSPYARFALTFSGLFTLAYSGVGNFGLLVLHRTQLLPFYFVPLAQWRRPAT